MPKYYLLDENKNFVEGYDKEGVLALLEEVIENGDLEHIDADSAFVSKFKSLLNGTTHHLEFVTQAQYNQLVADEELVPNTYYFITDDTTAEDLEEHCNNIDSDTESLINRATALEDRVEHIEAWETDVEESRIMVGKSNYAEHTDFSEYFISTNIHKRNIGGINFNDSYLEIAPTDEGYNDLLNCCCLVWLERGTSESNITHVYNLGIIRPLKQTGLNSDLPVFDYNTQKLYARFQKTSPTGGYEGKHLFWIKGWDNTPSFSGTSLLCWKAIK